MSVRLKEVVFKIRCTEPGCRFVEDVSVRENIMGETEADVDSEAWKIARNLAYNKHDAIHGRFHPLANPKIIKMSGSYDRMGGTGEGESARARPLAAVPTRMFNRGERILGRGEKATTVCEVIRGIAHNEGHPDLAYHQGAVFGAAALFQRPNRISDVVAGADGTVVACHDLRQLSNSDPEKARQLYNAAMGDIFLVLEHLDRHTRTLERQLATMKAAKKATGRKKLPSRKPAGKKAPKGKRRA